MAKTEIWIRGNCFNKNRSAPFDNYNSIFLLKVG